jgi:hypothetical protein
LRSRDGAFRWLLAKEWRELWSARAWWVLLLVTGPLVGLQFASATQLYAELSGYNGTSEGVGEAFSPLVGVWAPTFSVYELIAAFLFPFVVIRLVAGDGPTGVRTLEWQQPIRPWARVSAKALVLLAAWCVALVPAALAGVLWMGAGGAVYWPEVVTVAGGHLVNGLLTIAIGAAAATITDHPSTAAILALTVTVGGWLVSFLAAIHGGWWDRAAAFTSTAVVAQFQHGLVRGDVLVATVAISVGALAAAAIWLRLGVPVARRAAETAALAVGVAGILAAALLVRASWDASENRQNSFPEADEEVLRAISAPLVIDVHLAAEDGRRFSLERLALAKLRRVMRDLTVNYVARTSTGVFEQADEGYGEVRYTLGAAHATSRVVTAEGVLETIYGLAGVAPPVEDEAEVFRGHPLATPPRHVPAVFCWTWPAAVAGSWFLVRRMA